MSCSICHGKAKSYYKTVLVCKNCFRRIKRGNKCLLVGIKKLKGGKNEGLED